jgi:hypothetical protein
MAILSAILLLVTAPTDQGRSNWQPKSGAEASARATVRILSGARVKLGQSGNADPGAFTVTKAKVRTQDGVARPAYLVEFQ